MKLSMVGKDTNALRFNCNSTKINDKISDVFLEALKIVEDLEGP